MPISDAIIEMQRSIGRIEGKLDAFLEETADLEKRMRTVEGALASTSTRSGVFSEFARAALTAILSITTTLTMLYVGGHR